MKTTVEIPDALFEEAKRIAARNGVPLRELFELGLRRVIESESQRKEPFRLKKSHHYGRGGLVKPDMTWEEIRDIIYEGRGT